MEEYNHQDESGFKDLDDEEKSLFLQKKILRTGLFHPNKDINFRGYTKIFIDLDSLLSRLISEELPVDNRIRNQLIDFIMSNFAEFFSDYADLANIYILYGFKRNKIFDDIYPEWNKERYKRFENESVVNFINNELLRRFKIYSKTVKNVNIIKYKKSFLTDVMKVLNVLENPKEAVILSRNPQILCLLTYYNISIYDGKDMVTRQTYSMIKGYPTVHYSLIPHWFLLRGDKRNGYNGYPRMGPKITDNYIEKNKEGIISFEDSRIKSLEKYRKLYFLKELI